MIDTEEPEVNLADAIVDTQPQVFETMVIASVLRDADFFESTLGVLCTRKETGKWEDEFHNPLHNAIYRMQQLYYLHMLEHDGPKLISETMARATLTRVSEEGLMLSLDEVDEAVDLVLAALDLDPAEALTTAKAGYYRWLTKGRYTRYITSNTARDDWDPVLVQEKIRIETEAVEVQNQEETVYCFGHAARNKTLDIKRYPLGIPRLDKVLGGGVGRKEGLLFIAGQGAGKTVAACQFAPALALENLKTLLITTEQPHEQLEARIVSNYCNIPFTRLVDKVDLEKLTENELEKFYAFEKKLNGNLYYANWKGDHAISIAEDLDREVRKLIKKWGRLDAIILDWIGGAMGSMKHADPTTIRHVYQGAADAFISTMERYNLVGIAFAQGHETLSRNKLKVDSSTLSECKSMGRRFTNGVGITCLQEDVDAEAAQGGAMYKPIQYFWPYKVRKGEAASVPFRRDFGFQRMASTY
jgi:DnaB helicase-like protein